MKDDEGFKEKMFWMCNGSQIVILCLSIVSSMVGFWQIPKLAVSSTKPLELDRLLLSCTIIGVYIFAIFGAIVGGLNFDNQKLLAIFSTNILLMLQVRPGNINYSCLISINYLVMISLHLLDVFMIGYWRRWLIFHFPIVQVHFNFT